MLGEDFDVEPPLGLDAGGDGRGRAEERGAIPNRDREGQDVRETWTM